MKYYDIPHLNKKAAALFMGTGWFVPEQEPVVFSLLDAYFAAGGNAIDTGRFYSGGKAEGVITRWLESRNMQTKRELFIIVNKACHHYVDADNVHYPDQSRVTPAHITEDLEYSLENMKQKYFDIYLLHRDNPEEPIQGLVDRLEQHRREGKLSVYGVSNWQLDRIAEAQAYAKAKGYPGIALNSPSYSLATVTSPRWAGCVYADKKYVAWHKSRNIAILSWAPQASGFFAEIFGNAPPDDIRRTYFTGINREKLRRCKLLAREKGVSATSIALVYVCGNSLQVMASVGPRNLRELEECLNIFNCTISPEEAAWLNCEGPSLRNSVFYKE